MTTAVTRIGNTVVISGELTAGEDVVIDGTVNGQVTVPEQVVTVGPAGRVDADVLAKAIRILGKLTGSVKAATRVDIERMAVIDGELIAPVVTMADGATFNGTLNTRASEAAVSVAKYRHNRANATSAPS